MTDRTVNCREALALLHDYLKEELTAENQDRVAAHLAACGHCFQHAEFERNFLAAVERAARNVQCPEALLARIRSALERGGTG